MLRVLRKLSLIGLALTVGCEPGIEGSSKDDPFTGEAKQAESMEWDPDADLTVTCPATTADVDFEKELLITHTYLVDSDRAKLWSGVPSNTNWQDGTFNFSRLMEDMRGRDGEQQNGLTYTTYSLSEYIHRWLDEMERDDVVNCDVVPGRTGIAQHIRNVWPKKGAAYIDEYITRVGDSQGGTQKVERPTLKVTEPPFRLLAVVFRPDLADLTPPRGHEFANVPEFDPPQAGELRLVYGLIDSGDYVNGAAKNFTVAFEYSIPAENENDVTLWQKRWRNALAPTTIATPQWLDNVSKLVWEVTRNNGSRNTTNSLYPKYPCLGCGQPRPHDNNLHQLRTNDYKVLGATQEFREFRIPLKPVNQDPGGAPVHFYLAQTMTARFLNGANPSAKLKDYVDKYCEHIAVEHHKVPLHLPTEAGAQCDAADTANSIQAGRINNKLSSTDWWNVDTTAFTGCSGLSTNEIRHRFSRNTCNGCHGYEMGFRADTAANNFMIRPRAHGVASTLSPFLAAGTHSVSDPKTGLVRDFTERFKRKTKYKNVLCSDTGFDQSAYPTTWR